MFKQKSDTASTAPAPTDPVQQARTRARQRLIGAVILLVVGIIGFPLVFETQPRPIPVDIPIEIPKRDALPPLAPPPATVSSTPAAAVSPASRPRQAPVVSVAAPKGDEGMITESRNEAGREIPPPRAGASTPGRVAASAATLGKPAASAVKPAASAVKPAASAAKPSASAAKPSASAAKPAASAAKLDGDGDRARALLEGRPAGTAAPAEGQRFVVQVGAFADADAARETRLKVEKLGLKTYTQVAQTPSGSRIRVRVGPFTSRADAEAALAKAVAAGLTAVVLTL